MKNLFEPTYIRSVPLKNRFIRSATWEGLAGPEGEPTRRLIDKMVNLAQGNVGLIISSHAFITKQGQATPFQLGIYKSELLPAYQRLTQNVHEHGSKILLQLAHAGHFADSKLTHEPPLVVSLFDDLSQTPRKEITKHGIKALINNFGQAARRAKEAGFDGIQLHSAHGYFLSQFLSPAFNKRKDEYGGSLENRMRIHLETYNEIRSIVGNDFLIFIKINSKDFVSNGLNLDESVQVAKTFSEIGFDAIEVSGGFVAGGKLSPSCMNIHEPKKEAYFKKFAAKIKKAITIPLILVGGNRSLENMQELLTKEIADYFSMSRPFICEPNLIKRWQSGDKHKSECISCNLCFQPGFEGHGIYCVNKKKNEK